MNITPRSRAIFTSREFNQDTARAKREAAKGPVFITDRGRPSHVLMTMAEFERLEAARPASKPFRSLADALADDRPEADFDFEVPQLTGFSLRVPDLDDVST